MTDAQSQPNTSDAFDDLTKLEMALAQRDALRAKVDELTAALRAIYAVDTGKNGLHGAIVEMHRITRAAL
jgi:hypothetical protein